MGLTISRTEINLCFTLLCPSGEWPLMGEHCRAQTFLCSERGSQHRSAGSYPCKQRATGKLQESLLGLHVGSQTRPRGRVRSLVSCTRAQTQEVQFLDVFLSPAGAQQHRRDGHVVGRWDVSTKEDNPQPRDFRSLLKMISILSFPPTQGLCWSLFPQPLSKRAACCLQVPGLHPAFTSSLPAKPHLGGS